MTKLIEQVLALTGKFMECILDWPFLLFIFLAWIMVRYRDQIGSMLDRRGAVGVSTLTRAVSQEMAPVMKQVHGMGQMISELRYEVERLQAMHAENRLAALLDPIKTRISGLEAALKSIRAETEKMIGTALQDALNQERSAVQGELQAVRRSLDDQSIRLDTFAVKEVVDRLASLVKEAQAEIASITGAVDALRSSTEELASKAVAEELAQRIETLQAGSTALRQFLVETEALVQNVPARWSEDLKLGIEPIVGQLAKIREHLSAVYERMGQFAALEVTDRLGVDLEALTRELAAVRESVGRLETVTASASKEQEDRFRDRVGQVDLEISSVKGALADLERQLTNAADREDLDQLKSEISPLSDGMEALSRSLSVMEEAMRSSRDALEDRLCSHVEPIDREISSVKAALSDLERQLANAANREDTDQLKNELAPLSESIEGLNASLSILEEAMRSSRDALEDRLCSHVEPIDREISAVKAALGELETRLANAADREDTNQLKTEMAPLSKSIEGLTQSVTALQDKVASVTQDMEDRFVEFVGRTNQEVGTLRQALEQRQSAGDVSTKSEPPAAARATRDPGTDLLAGLRKALVSSGRSGKRIDALAKAVGLSEDQAIQILESSAEFTLFTNSKGHKTARLSKR